MMKKDCKEMEDFETNYHSLVPKKSALEKRFWYVNAGLLSNLNYDKAILLVATTKLSSYELQFVLFLGVKYLIHYIELYIFDPTNLLMECISKQLRYLKVLLGKQKKAKYLLNYKYMVDSEKVFEKLTRTEIDNHVCRQMYIDHLEKLSLLFVSRIHIWQKNPRLQAYLFRYNFDPYRSAAIYNIFIIPNQDHYVNLMLRMDQKFIEKIESKCHCKILLTTENVECHFYPEFVSFEVMFDLYKGNYLGFLDMFKYILKMMNSTKYFAKSFRTILIEGSVLYNILTNVPVKKLKYLEKNVIAGLPVASFLDESSTSKRIYSILATMKNDGDQFNVILNEKRDGYFKSALKEEEAKKEFDESSCSLIYYEKHVNEYDLSILKSCVSDVLHSQTILSHFQKKYDNKILEINARKTEDKEKLIIDIKRELELIESINKIKVNKSLDPKSEYSSVVSEIVDSRNKKVKDIPNETESPRLDDNENNIENKSENEFNNLSPENQLNIIFNSDLNEYFSELSWVNHRLRLLMRCNTKENVDDLKNPIIYEKFNIRNRMKDKPKCQNQLKFTLYSKPIYKVINRANRYRIPSLTLRNSWLSEEANKILTEGLENKATSHSDDDTIDSSLLIPDENQISKISPRINEYLSGYDEKIKRFYLSQIHLSKQYWTEFLEKNIKFTHYIDEEPMENVVTIFESIKLNIAKELIVYSNPITKNIYSLIFFLCQEIITDKLFRTLIDGEGLNFDIYDKIISHSSDQPFEIKVKNRSTENNDCLVSLSYCIKVLIYDISQLLQHHCEEVLTIFSFHIVMLKNLLSNSEKNIKLAFKVLQLVTRLNCIQISKSSKFRENDCKEREKNLVKEMVILYEIIYRKPCCTFNSIIGICILYHTMRIEHRFNVVEPFLRLPDDHRLQRIEKKCNCCITLRTLEKSNLSEKECIVDIYYDYEKGNHFGTLSLLKEMMRFQHKLITIQNQRTLVMFPTGELWIFRDSEWMKQFFNH